ncbi:DUF2326 domain-containing protein [Allomesorhizobium alhagi]|nr:DUF2326 domain-containing protein [Mesorhizobium alhagi]
MVLRPQSRSQARFLERQPPRRRSLRRAIWSQVLSLFSEFSESLYKSPGRLVIDIDDTGYKFDVEIAGSPSEGISKMKIFCHDLTLISFARQRSHEATGGGTQVRFRGPTS